MARLAYAPIAVNSQATTYYGFRGIDRSRDIVMETQEAQNFWLLDNCYVDYRGHWIRDPKFFYIVAPTASCKVVKFYNREGVCYAEEDAANTHLASDRGHRVDSAFQKTHRYHDKFQGKVHIFCDDTRMYRYDGFQFSTATASIKPSFGVPIQRRLAVSDLKIDLQSSSLVLITLTSFWKKKQSQKK